METRRLTNKFVNSQIYKEIIATFVTNCPRKRHTRLLTSVENSFTGKEAVNFMVETYPLNPFNQQELTREKAVKLLELLLKDRHFHKFAAKQGVEVHFKDNSSLYCFKDMRKGENKEKSSSDMFSTTAASEEPEKMTVELECTSSSIEAVFLPSLDKLDVWYAYKSALECRLQEIDASWKWKVRGQDVQKNCEETKITEVFNESIMSRVNYLMKLPFSMDNRNIMAAFKSLYEQIILEPVFLTGEEAITILRILDGTDKNDLVVLRLFFLTLPFNRRSKLMALFQLMHKITYDDYSGCAMPMMLENLAHVVMPSNIISIREAKTIIQRLVCCFCDIFLLDRRLLQIVDEMKHRILHEKQFEYSQRAVTSSPRMFSSSSSSYEYSEPEEAPKNSIKESFQSMYELLEEMNEVSKKNSTK